MRYLTCHTMDHREADFLLHLLGTFFVVDGARKYGNPLRFILVSQFLVADQLAATERSPVATIKKHHCKISADALRQRDLLAAHGLQLQTRKARSRV